jgi:hypothetical protein
MPDSTYEAVLDAVEAVLRGLELDGLEKRVYRHTILDQTWAAGIAEYPCLAVGPIGTSSEVGMLTGSDTYSEPVTIRVLDRWPVEDTGRLGQLLKWRHQVRKALHNKRLPTVPGAMQMQLQAGPVVEPEAAAYMLHSLPLTFQVQVREVR